MTLYYDPGLGMRLNSNSCKTGAVFNRTFEGWSSTVESGLMGGSKELKYVGHHKRLLKKCQRHAKSYATAKDTDNVLMMVHPFYMYLSHMNHLKGSQHKEAEDYLNNLFDLLARLPREKTSPVILETAHHYASTTSLLLEQGMIDDVIFTLPHQGYPVNDKDLKRYKGKTIFIAGGYNGNYSGSFQQIRCLDQSIWALKEHASRKNKDNPLILIRELILNTPNGNSGNILLSDEEFQRLSQNNVSLEEALEMMAA